MYSEKVMDHFQHPRNVGEIENASGVGTVGNAKCGDIMRIYLDIDDNQVIVGHPSSRVRPIFRCSDDTLAGLPRPSRAQVGARVAAGLTPTTVFSPRIPAKSR